MRIAICGVGSAAVRAHLPALARAFPSLSGVVGIYDNDPDRLTLTLPEVPEAAPFENLDRMLEATKPDVLVVATPPSAHRDALSAAVSQGVHVLCEKPVGLSPADVNSLALLRSLHPEVMIATVLQYRHAPTWQRFQEEISRRAGTVPFHLTFTVERPGTDPLSAGGWRAQPFLEGGILGDHAVHYLGLCWSVDPRAEVTGCRRWGEGATEVASVLLALAGGTAEINVSYRGVRRRNAITLASSGGDVSLRWEDSRLWAGTAGAPEVAATVESLSDRETVNGLYVSMYRELAENFPDRSWRDRRTAETVDVASMLVEALVATDAEMAGA